MGSLLPCLTICSSELPFDTHLYIFPAGGLGVKVPIARSTDGGSTWVLAEGNVLSRGDTLLEDPWIDLYETHVSDACHNILWGEQNFGVDHPHSNFKNLNDGILKCLCDRTGV
jgi:hypothetical protein